MNILISKCSIHVPLRRRKEARKFKFQKKRRILMRKRTKLSRIIVRTPQIISQLLSIEEQISSSHLKEKTHEEHVAVPKIKVDPKHFFRYAKGYSICKQDNIMHMINNKSTVDMIYLNFSKAFDKVDHGIPLYKLRDLGIRGRLGLWFFHFLNNRQHYVRMPGGIIFMVYDIDQLYLLINNNNVALIKHHVLFPSQSLKAPTVPSSIYTKLLPAI